MTKNKFIDTSYSISKINNCQLLCCSYSSSTVHKNKLTPYSTYNYFKQCMFYYRVEEKRDTRGGVAINTW